MKKMLIATAFSVFGAMASAAEIAPKCAKTLPLVVDPASNAGAAQRWGNMDLAMPPNRPALDKAVVLGGLFFVAIATALLASPYNEDHDTKTMRSNVRMAPLASPQTMLQPLAGLMSSTRFSTGRVASPGSLSAWGFLRAISIAL